MFRRYGYLKKWSRDQILGQKNVMTSKIVVFYMVRKKKLNTLKLVEEPYPENIVLRRYSVLKCLKSRGVVIW